MTEKEKKHQSNSSKQTAGRPLFFSHQSQDDIPSHYKEETGDKDEKDKVFWDENLPQNNKYDSLFSFSEEDSLTDNSDDEVQYDGHRSLAGDCCRALITLSCTIS